MIRYKCFEKPASAKIKNNVLTRKLCGEVAAIQKNLNFCYFCLITSYKSQNSNLSNSHHEYFEL